MNETMFCMLMLALHPEIDQKLYDEIKDYSNNGMNELDYETVKKMPYLDMVVKETLRLLPVVPIVGRQCIQDVELGNLNLFCRTLFLSHLILWQLKYVD